jgi:hypothetical protein
MRLRHAAAAALVALAVPAAAQVAPHAVSLEAGPSFALSGPRARAVPVALSAARWLEGDVDVVLRVAQATAARTEGRPAAGWYAGTIGLRWSLRPGPVRPQLLVEAGWARGRGPGAGAGRLALGAGGGLEWFLARDVAAIATCALRRGADPGARLEAAAGAIVYF